MGPAEQQIADPLGETRRLLLSAIEQRRPIAAVYGGLPRLLCPHVLGRGGSGELRVFCYQFGGQSRTGLHPKAGAGNWRCLAVDGLGGVELLDQPWRTEPHSPQRCVEQVEAEAAQPGPQPQNGH